MNYSLPENSPFTNHARVGQRKSDHYPKTAQALKKCGIPDYSTISPFVNNSAGYMRKPLMNPTSSTKPEDMTDPEHQNMQTPTRSTPPGQGITTPPAGSTPMTPPTTTPPVGMPPTGMPSPGTPPAGMPSTPRTTMPQTTPPTTPRTTMPQTTPPATPGTTMPPTTSPAAPGTNMPQTTPPATPRITMPAMPNMPDMNTPGSATPTMPSPQTNTPGTSTQQLNTNPAFTQDYTATDTMNCNDKSGCPFSSRDYMDMYPTRNPMGIPMMPLYGYDNCEDADKDWNYMRQMYPLTAKRIMVEIDEECDKLEYDGSCMFDEYPDCVYLGRIVDRVYEKVKYLDEDSATCAESIDSDIEANQFDRDFRRDRDRDRDRDRRRRRSGNTLRDLIEVLLFNELLNRRRRFRGRRRWF